MKIGQQIVLHERIGKGGFGEVYRCSDENNNVFVAKICDTNPKYGLASPMELSIMASFKHPYLNPCLKIHTADKKIYIFQELAISDLSKLVRKDKSDPSYYKPTPNDLKRWLSSIVHALQCLHNNRIVHADIKASNVLIFKNGDDNNNLVAKLSDFTVSQKLVKDAKFRHTVCTSTHRPLENFIRKEWDYSLDIWCLGVTIYEVIYGTLLFPYQGNLGKRRDSSGKKVKDHIDERCINCLLDWADNGPKKQDHNYQYTTYKYHRFDLVPEFYNDRFKVNEILLRMLSLDPAKRPTISEIIKHPFFSGNVKNIEYGCYNIESHLENLSTSRRKSITKICINHELPEIVIKNIMCLYASYDNGNQSKLLKLHACILICCKLYRLNLPEMQVDPIRLQNMERNICSNLEYKLHL